jgi:alanine dehydrogenase
MGVKVIARLPSRTGDVPGLTSHIMLYDLESGNLLALVDGNYITAMRTGSVAAYSLKLFAKEDFKTIGIIGLGITAAATFEIITQLFFHRELQVKLYRYKEQAEQFIDRFKANTNISFTIVDTLENVICDSDVIISCVTYAEKNLADDSCYKEGCTVIPVHTMGFQNCDLFFDKVFGDDTGHISGFKYFDSFKKFAEVSDVVLERTAGRENKDERILVYNVGVAMHDVYLASKFYQAAPNAPEVPLSQPLKKMWL